MCSDTNGSCSCGNADILPAPGAGAYHGQAPSATGNGEEARREACAACCDTSAAAAAVAGAASLSVYRIAAMDCPVEAALIRKKLAAVPGIVDLEFNLLQRILKVRHNNASAASIEAALRAIDMTPEPLAPHATVSVFSVSGMEGPEEEALIRDCLAKMPEVLALESDLLRRTLTVQHDASALPAIAAALESLKLGARPLKTQEREAAVPAPHIPWKKLLIAGIFAALSEGLELIHAGDIRPFGVDMAAWTWYGFPAGEYVPLLCALVAIALSGLTTYRKGWLAISHRNLNINALMSVAVTGAVIIGQYPEAAMVMVLFTLSEAIEARALQRARNAIQGLLALAPDTATVRQPDGTWKEMDIRCVATGSRVRVKPGEKIALDGIVVTGQSTVNQAAITGESMPVEKSAGMPVYAGTVNGAGAFEYDVNAVATESTLARIIHAVEEAQGSRAPLQRFVDSFASYYTPAVFLLALLTALVPPLCMEAAWLPSLYTALVLLVIGCPCALVISTPVTIVSGLAAATRYGILIKGGSFLEQGRRLTWLALDKTGTITHGTPRQTDFLCLGTLEKDQVASLAASLAARSDHPVSAAIAHAAREAGVELSPVEAFTALPGQGIRGSIAGRIWYLGNQRMVDDLRHGSAGLAAQIARLEQQGKTVVALVGEHGPEGLFAVADTVRESSREAIGALHRLGVKTLMLTGDNAHTAAAIARQVGVSRFKADLLPADKLAAITELEQQGGRVGMVGDGINDAPALARAHIGFAMARGGTDTAIETADVALMDDDLRKIPRFIRLSRATYAILIQNIVLALGIKALFFLLTFTGHATMWMAVFADVGTALLVVCNGLRARHS